MPEPLPAAALATDSSPSNVAIGTSSSAELMMPLPDSWSRTWRPCVWASGIAVLVMALGLNPAVAMFGSGIVAVSLYRQQFPGAAIRGVVGAKLGALSALVGFVVAAVLESVTIIAFHKEGEMRQRLLEVIQQAAARGGTDPQTQAMFDYFKTPAGLIIMAACGLVFTLFICIALGSLGGALAGTFAGRRNRS